MLRQALLGFIAVLALSGCAASQAGVTSGRIGCPEDEVQIANTGTGTWTATCRGRTYYCVSSSPPHDVFDFTPSDQDISCTQAIDDGPIASRGLTEAAEEEEPQVARGCDPECSPGFACRGSTCVPQCNPSCGAGMWCAAIAPAIPLRPRRKSPRPKSPRPRPRPRRARTSSTGRTQGGHRTDPRLRCVLRRRVDGRGQGRRHVLDPRRRYGRLDVRLGILGRHADRRLHREGRQDRPVPHVVLRASDRELPVHVPLSFDRVRCALD